MSDAGPTRDEVRLVSVNVALPGELGRHRGRAIVSAIAKRPVVGAALLHLDQLNLAGDRQADLRVHGGPDKAVYAYASEHLPWWSLELGQDLGAGAFGENLTTAGASEADVAIGDVWSWGDALLQVAQPRWPCFKLALHRRTGSMQARFRRAGRTGWYLRVLRPGAVPVAGPIRVEERDPAGVTVLDAHRATFPGEPAEAGARVLAVPALADEWRHIVERVVRGA